MLFGSPSSRLQLGRRIGRSPLVRRLVLPVGGRPPGPPLLPKSAAGLSSESYADFVIRAFGAAVSLAVILMCFTPFPLGRARNGVIACSKTS